LKSNPSGDALPPDFAAAVACATDRLGRLASRIVFLPRTGSTNDVASGLVMSGVDEGVVVVADSQTAGRGRRGHVWLSPPGSGLYVSVVLTPARATDPERATRLITLAAGVALAEGIEAVTACRVDLKWPNDLYIERRKLGGILAEGATSGTGISKSRVEAVVLGYGINVGSTRFPSDLAPRATSLEAELGRPVDRARVFAETLAALARRYDDLLACRFDAILDEWRARAPGGRGARVSWTTASGTQIGVTDGIDDDGALFVRVDGRTERIVAGELTWL
jgi:BirA family transcriptional regulator, biotin operon repressor / biotin---[acetyl-CoA-carboxylase] ligase